MLAILPPNNEGWGLGMREGGVGKQQKRLAFSNMFLPQIIEICMCRTESSILFTVEK
jgi:hypothetical protein